MKKLATLNPSLRFGLGCNFIALIVIILSITMGSSTYYNYKHDQHSLLERLTTKGKLLGNFVAGISKDAILGYDFILLEQYMKDIAANEEIIYSLIIAPDQSVFASKIKKPADDFNNKNAASKVVVFREISKLPNVIAQKFPIYSNSRLIGTLHIGLSRQKINRLSQIALINHLQQSTVIILILAFSIAVVFKKYAIKPIQELIESTEHIADGKTDTQVKTGYTREFSRLAKSFNLMSKAIHDSNADKDKTLGQLQDANIKLANATRAKSEFLANMSHEIRTPLTAILGYAESLQYGEINQARKNEATNSILKNGQHLQRIVNEILDLTKIEENKLEIQCHDISPIKLITELESLISLDARNKGLDFSVKYTLPIPKKINTDPIRLKQILLNLCHNAIKFTPQGSVTVTVSYQQDQQLLTIAVIDTGIGLTSDQQQKIFNPFTQADASTTREFGGTGLGLTLSAKLAKLLGGDIHVISTKGLGSHFILTIPTGDISENHLLHELTQDDSTSTILIAEKGLPKLSGEILLAEDTIDNQKLFSLQIQRMGLNLQIVNNGLEAIEAVRLKEFDLILMDMQMPVMGGLEAVQRLRSMGYNKPIVALTANVFKEFRQKCLDSGCNDYIPKPVDWTHFHSVISGFLSGDHLSAQLNPLHSELTKYDSDFQSIIDGFLAGLPATRDNFRKFYAARDWETCSKLTHELKGLGGAMGYPDLSTAARNLEDKIKSESFADIKNDYEYLNAIIERMLSGNKSAINA